MEQGSFFDVNKSFIKKACETNTPILGSFEITPRCTMNCKMCYLVMTEEQVRATDKERTAKQWLDLAEQACKEGMLILLITGGEPFLRKDFREIYEGLSKMGLIISINSNGTLIDDATIEWLSKTPPSRINITMYGGTNETYRDFCGFPNGFDRVSQAVDKLLAAKIPVRINTTFTPENVQDADIIKKFANDRNLVVYNSSYIFPPFRKPGTNYVTTRLDIDESIKCAYKVDSRFSRIFQQARGKHYKDVFEKQKQGLIPNTSHLEKDCIAGKCSFWVTWQGHMSVCGMLDDKTTNVFETGFKDAWDITVQKGNAYRMPKKCGDCEYGFMCTACVAQNIAETGSLDDVSERLCESVKRAFEETVLSCETEE